MSLNSHSNLYLSDDLYVELLLERVYLNQYLNYTISKSDVYNNNETIIFTGRIYYYEYGQRIYLNDIISSHSIDYSTLIPTPTNVVGEIRYDLKNTPGVYQNFVLNIYHNNQYVIGFPIGPILSYYKDLDLPKGDEIDIEANGFYNVLEQRTKILPRIPKLSTYLNTMQGFTNNFYFSVLWIPTKDFLSQSYVGDRQVYKICAKNIKGETLNYIEYNGGDWVHGENINGYDLAMLTSGSPKEIGICGIQKDDMSSELNYKKVADIDLTPADYYLIWYDRTGAYQCQPFSKRSIHTENITSNNLVNNIEETRPYEKLVENKWTINSDWLTDEEYKAYESIFTSPYHYLYDSKLNAGWWVNCNDKTYTQKTYKNQKKLFNITINLTANKNQRMLF